VLAKAVELGNLTEAGANFQSAKPESLIGSGHWLQGSEALLEPKSWSHDSEAFFEVFLQ